MEWKLHRSGWIEERNFDIEFAEVPEGFHTRVRIIGFPVLEDTKNVFPTEALAEKGALTLLKSQPFVASCGATGRRANSASIAIRLPRFERFRRASCFTSCART